MLLQILLDDKLTPRQASAIAGKLQLFAQSMFGKASVAAVRPFHQQQQQGWQLSLGLKSAIAVLHFRLANAKPRILHFHVDYRSVIYADAFFNLGGLSYKLSEADSAPDWGKTSPASFVSGLGFVVSVGEITCFAHGFVPYWFARHFSSRRSFIYGFGAAFAPSLSSLWTMSQPSMASLRGMGRMRALTSCFWPRGCSLKR